MLHQPSKYHPNPLTHLLNLHSTNTSQNSPGSNHHHHLDVENTSTTSLDVVHGNIGKSFTIAAILGLKKAAAAAENNNFNDVMNLSLNQTHLKNVNNFENENRLINGNGSLNLNIPLGQHYNHHHHHNGASALQSLQQLHQHHANSAGFHSRERNREQISNKKTSLKSKRVRTIFTPEQLERLEAEFERQQYMVGPERLYLAHTLQLTEAQVKVWFQNRRIKWRKHHLELTQQRLAILRQRQIPTDIQSMENHIPSESELTICTDSMDNGSVQEGDDS